MDNKMLGLLFKATSDNIAGIHYISGQTIIAGNKVVVVKCNNSPKSSDWYCVKLS